MSLFGGSKKKKSPKKSSPKKNSKNKAQANKKNVRKRVEKNVPSIEDDLDEIEHVRPAKKNEPGKKRSRSIDAIAFDDEDDGVVSSDEDLDIVNDLVYGEEDQPPVDDYRDPGRTKREALERAKRRKANAVTLEEERQAEELIENIRFSNSDQPEYWRSKPRSGNREKLIRFGYMFTAVATPVFLVFSAVSLVNAHNLNKELQSQIGATYNPSLRERNADIAKSAIYAYYNADPIPPVSVARGISWPGGSSSSQPTDVENLDSSVGSSGDSEEEGVNTIGTGAKINASVKNLSLEQSQVWDKQGSEDEIRRNPALENSLMQSLTFRGEFNGSPAYINVVLQTPGAKSPQELTMADNVQPPILVSVPTVTPATAAVSGAPGSNDPGTRGGEFEPVSKIQDTVMKTIETWAKAYTADDRAALRSIVQDPQDRSYIGMQGGWTLKEGTVKSQWQYVRQSDDLMVVGVSFIANQAIRSNKSSDKPFETDNVQMMELLIDYSKRGTPVVLAWGVGGSAPNLKPYQNAIDDNRVPRSTNKPSEGPVATVPEATATTGSSSGSSSTSEPLDGGSSNTDKPTDTSSTDSNLDFNEEDFY